MGTRGSGGRAEPPVAVVGWAEAWEFRLDTEERPARGRRKKAVHGPLAFRVPGGWGEQRVLAPCAFPAGEDSSLGRFTGLRVCTDPAGVTLLCSVGAAEDEAGMRAFPVRDAAGAEIGRVRTAAPLRKVLNPEWFLDQPGRPEVVSRHDWARGSASEVVLRGAGKATLSVLGSMLSPGEGGDRPSARRAREWRADGELVMTSDANRAFLLRADWLDRRLVFAYALLRTRVSRKHPALALLPES
ncbi:hypothetical protein [Streptomyces physcomitrii]|uniref:Uncharacterized protein n=1 Tax=Streptomyces physcomitrii TaxID=2724184 RepID=A0ABX1HA83_9ACTN|nr:hypothetical protein [Streptomyces physcomitrii]NKI45311.1 hypothetical protein [Streptomyces physcomitrii]